MDETNAESPQGVAEGTEEHCGPLTRASLAGGSLRRMLEQAGFGALLLTPEALEASLAATLAARPATEVKDTAQDVWLFAYGSLIWNPAIQFAERRAARLIGWHRRFAHATPVGRGTRENPGLVLALVPGGSCRGAAYRIEGDRVRDELALVWAREMPIGSYVPRWGRLRLDDGRRVTALAFIANMSHALYEPLMPHAAVVERIATAAGALGTNREYLTETMAGLAAFGITDRALARIARDVGARALESEAARMTPKT